MAKEISFEKAIVELEEIVKKLEVADVTLDESIALFEAGIKLSTHCQKTLEKAEQRVNVILKDEAGNMVESDFNINAGE